MIHPLPNHRMHMHVPLANVAPAGDLVLYALSRHSTNNKGGNIKVIIETANFPYPKEYVPGAR